MADDPPLSSAVLNSMQVIADELSRKEERFRQIRLARKALVDIEKRMMEDAFNGELKDSYAIHIDK